MAKITHRDPSTLPGFERGLSAPRDLDAVVAAYQGLEGTDERAIARAAHAERKVRRWPPVYVALVAVVALVALATHAQDERGRFQRAEQLTSCLAGISCLQRGENLLQYRLWERRPSSDARGSRQEADEVDALARSCGCTRAAYMRYAGRYLAAAVRLEVIAREEVSTKRG